MQSLSLERSDEPSVVADHPLFSGLLLPTHNWVPAIGMSLVLHCLAVACALLAQQYLPLFQPDSLDGRYTFKAFPMPVSQKLYYFVEPQAQRPVPRRAAPVTPSAPAAPRRAQLRLPPGVSIPPLPEPPKVSSLVIQPSGVVANLLSTLPAISAWAPRERPVPKAFVQPGRTRSVPQTPVLDAPPTLDRPNNESRLSDMNFAAMPTVAAPALPRPPASTTPVRVVEPFKLPADVPNAGIGGREGDAVNLITAGPVIPPPNTYVSVPPGVAGVLLESVPAPSAAAAAGKPGTGQGSAAGAPAIELTAARETAPPMPPGAIRVTRPIDGHYTFMVTGSKPEESFPEAAGLLSGKLVYTVYLGIGARPDWTLQYCLPASAPVAAAGPLASPYPYLMFRPKLSYDWDGEHLFVHGMLNEQGKLERLEPVGEATPADKAALLASLVRWEFRPATRGGKPTAVEVLLIVPRPQP
jgi:hypothetical protein